MSNPEDDDDSYKKNLEFPVTTTDGNFIASLFPIGALVGGTYITSINIRVTRCGCEKVAQTVAQSFL
jgi:hypothetical protein